MAKLKKNGGSPKELLMEALAAYGIDEKNALGLVNGIDQFKNIPEVPTPQSNGDKPLDGNGHGPDSGDMWKNLDEYSAKTDLAEWVVKDEPDRFDNSECPGTVLMDMVLSECISELATPGCNIDPWVLYRRKYFQYMKAFNRKRVKEAIELFQSGAEKDAMGSMGKGAFST